MEGPIYNRQTFTHDVCHESIYGAHIPIKFFKWFDSGGLTWSWRQSGVSSPNVLAVGILSGSSDSDLSKSALSLSSSFYLILLSTIIWWPPSLTFEQLVDWRVLRKNQQVTDLGTSANLPPQHVIFQAFTPSGVLFLAVYVGEMSQRKFSLKCISPSLLIS